MNSALKKLKKNSKKQPSISSLVALKRLPKEKSSVVQSELIEIVKHSGLDVLSEIKTPLNPIISWFDEAQVITLRSKLPVTKSKDKAKGVMRNYKTSLANLPLKSPACKKCPALNNGLCKCALKRFK